MKQIIKLIVDNQVLDMGGAVVNHTLNNPYLKSQGSYSLPFTIPLTERNKAILQIDHDIHEYGYSESVDARLELGLFTIQGSLVMKSSKSPGYLKAHLISGRGTFFADASKVYLTDLTHTDTIGVSGYFVYDSTWLNAITAMAKSSYPTYNYVFAPIYMPEFPDDDISSTPQFRVVNYWSVEDNAFVYKSHAGTYGNCYAPFYYVCCVIKEVFAHFGYTIDENEFYDNTELRQSVVFHTNHEDYHGTNTISFAKHLPKMLCSDFILALESKFNMRFDINEQNKIVNLRFRENVMEGTTIEDLTDQADPDSEVEITQYTGFKISDGLDSEDSYISDNTPDLGEAINNDDLDHEEINQSDISSPSLGDLALVTGKNVLLRYERNYSSGSSAWNNLGQSVQDYSEEDGDNNYQESIRCSHLLMESVTHDDLRLVARSDLSRWLQIIENVQPAQYKKLSILLFRGLIPYNVVEAYGDLPGSPTDGDYCFVHDDDKLYRYQEVNPGIYDWQWTGDSFPGSSTVNVYPFLTNSKYYEFINGDWAVIPDATIDLNLFGSAGLYETFFKKWLYWFIELRRVENRIIHFNHETFMSLAWDTKYRIKEQNYLIGSIEIRIDFDNQRIIFGDSELHSIH